MDDYKNKMKKEISNHVNNIVIDISKINKRYNIKYSDEIENDKKNEIEKIIKKYMRKEKNITMKLNIDETNDDEPKTKEELHEAIDELFGKLYTLVNKKYGFEMEEDYENEIYIEFVDEDFEFELFNEINYDDKGMNIIFDTIDVANNIKKYKINRLNNYEILININDKDAFIKKIYVNIRTKKIILSFNKNYDMNDMDIIIENNKIKKRTYNEVDVYIKHGFLFINITI